MSSEIQNTVTLLRDDIEYVDGLPFRRLMLYRVQATLPLSVDEGMMLFSVSDGFKILSIETWSTILPKNDCSYVVHDAEDGELVGRIAIMAGNMGPFPMEKPSVAADLTGPSSLFIQYAAGQQLSGGQIVMQIQVSGSPDGGDHGIVDADRDGIPDDLEGNIEGLPLSFEVFMRNYELGLNGASS